MRTIMTFNNHNCKSKVKHIALLSCLSLLSVSSGALATMDQTQTPHTQNLKSIIGQAIKYSDDEAKQVDRLKSIKNLKNMFCVMKEDNELKQYPVLEEGRAIYNQSTDKYQINQNEKKCWDLVKANYTILEENMDMSQHRDKEKDAYGNKEFIIYNMGSDHYLVELNNSNMMKEVIKKLSGQ